VIKQHARAKVVLCLYDILQVLCLLWHTKIKTSKLQGGPEKILLETIDSFVVNSNFCEPPYSLANCQLSEIALES